MSLHEYSYSNRNHDNAPGYTWYECDCCPYGYHIDLDFVRYCEYISKEVDVTGVTKRRKDRRRHMRQSIDALLGVTLSGSLSANNVEEMSNKNDSNNAYTKVQNTGRSAYQSVNTGKNLPDVTAVSVSKSSSNLDLDTVDSLDLTPLALQNIRKQMALSLERTKNLEDQVKTIPQLKNELSTLKSENELLLIKLREHEANEIKRTNESNHLNLTRDVGVMCTVLNRSIGVGNQYTKTRNISTTTENFNLSNLNSNRDDKLKSFPISVTRATQTLKYSIDKNTQTIKKTYESIGTSAIPYSLDVAIQKNVENRTIGISNDKINEFLCDSCESKCNKSSVSLSHLLIPQKDQIITLNQSTQYVYKEKKPELQNASIETCNFHCTNCQSDNGKKDKIVGASKIPRPQFNTRAVDKENDLHFRPSTSNDIVNKRQKSFENFDNKNNDDKNFKRKSDCKIVVDGELQGALKVLNDALLKNTSKKETAVSVVRREWFKVSSLITADSLVVEAYLDAFEIHSINLLEYIVNMSDDSGNTAMHYAISNRNFNVVSVLLDSKVCNVNILNRAGYSCVMLMSLAEIHSESDYNVARKLLQLADVNMRAKQHGQTALMLAASNGHLKVVEMLLNEGADVNIQDEDGSTALMCAAEHGHLDIVKLLLKKPECNSTLADLDGSTAIKIALEAGHRHIGVLLYAHQRNFYQNEHADI